MWFCALRTETLTGPAQFTVTRSWSPSPAPSPLNQSGSLRCASLSLMGGLRLPSAWLLPAVPEIVETSSQASRPPSRVELTSHKS